MRRLLALIPLGLLLAACGGGGSSNGEDEGASSDSSKSLQTIQVSEKEYSLNPSNITLPKPGTYTLEVTNDGQTTHALEVEQSGGDDENEMETEHIAPGESKTIQYTFSAGGKYEMYCPVDGHRQQGMEGEIRVGGGAAGAGTTTSDDSKTSTSGKGGYGY